MIIESLRSLATPIENLKALPGNPRKGDVDAVAKSLERFGQRKPIVARKDDGTIIAGNHTWQAAKKLGWSEIAVAFVGDDDVTAKAYALADNRTAELGSYDEQALIDLIEEVHAVVPEFVRDAGWSEEAVADLVAKIESEQSWNQMLENGIKEQSEYRQWAFTLSERQYQIISNAVQNAKKYPLEELDNVNQNANALTFICEQFNVS